jgi:AraC family transcriptional regulator, ethanolamine operon transcriptional activator
MSIDPVLNNQPWIGGGQFSDIDAQAAQLHGYGQQYQQLSRGPFEGRFRSFIFDNDLGIHFEKTNRVLAQSAATPTGRYAACLLTDRSIPCTINAETFSQSHVLLCPGSKSLEAKTSEGMSICVVDVSDELLPDSGQALQTGRILNDAGQSRQLRELVQSGLTTFTSLDCVSSYASAIKGFKFSIVDLLWEMATHSENQGVRRTNVYTPARALHVFRRAREYIHHCLPEGISIAALCTDIGVSRRSLEYVFRSVVGTGPGNYVRALQLNHIRRDLMLTASADVSIGEIAARRGLWNWSRFSRHYELLFGELPSQTRLRHCD